MTGHEKKQLLFSQVPASCSEDDLREWVEAKGYEISDLNLIPRHGYWHVAELRTRATGGRTEVG
jgi:hypothetical protein